MLTGRSLPAGGFVANCFTRQGAKFAKHPLRDLEKNPGMVSALPFLADCPILPAMHLAPWAYPLLVATGLGAGLVDSIAGGGGLIALPMLLSLGMPAPFALGTNKLQSLCGTSTAARHYVRSGVVDLRACRLGIALTFAGALAGTWAVQRLNSDILVRLLPWLLAAVFLHMVFQPEIGRRERPARLPTTAFYLIAGPALGFWDGFFGPAAGSFWTMAFVLLLGCDFVRATGSTKVMNLTSNLAAVALFAIGGHIYFAAGLTMAAGQVVGARLGAGLVVKKGARFVRPIFLIVVALTLARLFYIARFR
jgi:uncharacterized membrane protein YfcA